MHISSLEFKNFKNLDGLFELDTGANLLIKPNGWGKTNFLEAIDYFSSLKSFRGLSNSDLFDKGREEPFVSLVATIKDPAHILNLVLSKDRLEDSSEGVSKFSRALFIDDAKTNSRKFRSQLVSLIYSPHNADVVSSAPDIRRNAIDRIIERFFPEYSKLLKEYKFVVKSRNKLLTQIQRNEAQKRELDYWTDRLVSLGEEIITLRVRFLEEIKSTVDSLAANLFSADLQNMEIVYTSKVLQDSILIMKEKVDENLDKEIASGMTLYGPHRDNFEFLLKGSNLRDFGSRGQQRLAGIILVLAVHSKFFEEYEKHPILLFDDVFSELDEKHRLNLEKFLADLKDTQVIITSPYGDIFSEKFMQEVNMM